MNEPNIELIISPTQKVKAKGMVLSLLGQHGIDDESDINGIDYSQSDEISSLIGKCVIKFKKSEDAQKFYEHLSNQDESTSTLLSVKINDAFEHDDSDFDESASIDNVSSSSPMNAQSLYLKSKQASPHDMTRSCIVSNSDVLMMREEIGRKLRVANNNRVEFNITPAIANEDDLELILLLIQNSRRTGGGDIEAGYIVNPDRTALIVTYVEEECKKKVLSNLKFDFKNYTVTANEPFDEANFEKNKHVLIIRNIKIESEADYILVTLYAENLVPSNTIEAIETSKFFDSTHYVRYKNEYDFAQVELRQKRRPTIKRMQTEVLEAFKTNSLVGALENFDEISNEMLDLHFSNKNRSGVNKYLQMKNQKPFTIIQLYNREQVNSVLSRDHIFNKRKFVLENYYNSKLLLQIDQSETDTLVDEANIQLSAVSLDSPPNKALPEEKHEIIQTPLNEPKASKSNKDDDYIEVEQQQPSVVVLDYFDTLKKRLEESAKVESSVKRTSVASASASAFTDSYIMVDKKSSSSGSSNILIDEFKYKLNASEYRTVYELFKHNAKVLKEFNRILKPLNLTLTKHSYNKEAVFEFSFLEICDTMSFEEFKQKCNEIVRDFCQEFGVYFNLIELPPGLNRENVNLKDLAEAFPEVYLILKENGLEFYGFRKYFGDVVDKVNGLTTSRSTGGSNNENEQENAYELVLSSRKLSNLLVLQYLPAEFTNFKDLLRSYSAQCVKQSTAESGFLIKITGDTEVDTEILRHELNAIIDNYLSAFKIVTVECDNSGDVVSSLADKNLYMEAVGQKKVLICGRVAHVDKLVENIRRRSGGGDDVFTPQMNNIGLHEIRILYAVRYQADMENKYPNLKVKIDSKKFLIKFESDDRSAITEAMARAAEIFSQIKHKEFKCASVMIEFMRTNELEVVKWIKEKAYLTVLDINYSLNAYLVYGLDMDVIRVCNEELTKNLDLKMFKMTKENEDKIHSFIADETNRLIWTGEKRTSGYIAKIENDNNERVYIICGFKTKVEVLAKRFVDHLKTHK